MNLSTQVKVIKGLPWAAAAFGTVAVVGLGVHFLGSSHDTTGIQTPDELSKKEKKIVGALQWADIGRMQAEGYVVERRLLPFGRTCNANGTTDGTGYQGTNTAISYQVIKDEVVGRVCVTHSGAGGADYKEGPFVR